MKSYLSLIPISAKVHKRQNRMTLICIIISVLLVTAVFSIADMGVQMEKTRIIKQHGKWHIELINVSESDMKQISSRSDVAIVSWYNVINRQIEEDYYINDKKVVLSGADESYITEIWDGLKEGSYPQSDSEIMLGSNAKNMLGLKIGDSVTVNTPAGSIDYTVSGFGEDDSTFNNQNYVISAFMNRMAFQKLYILNSGESQKSVYYIQFRDRVNANRTIADIKKEYGWTDANISENTGLLGITGFSSNKTMQNFYSIAVVLFVLILAAGVLMISSSINSNVAPRTKFFGMMRCIGASREQIICFK